MKDLLFLVPLLVGTGVISLGFKIPMPKGPGMNRPAFDIPLMVSRAMGTGGAAGEVIHRGPHTSSAAA